MSRRQLQFRFVFTPIFGVYDTGESTIYVFGDHDGNIEDILGHETLHWAVQKVAGKKASLALDYVPSQSLRI